MLRSKKVFTGGSNQDDSLHLLDDAQYLRIMNGRVGVTQYGKNYRVEGVPGTSAISQSVYPPYGTNICIGSCIDIEGQRLIWFVYNTFNDHGIYAFDFATSTTYAVLYDSQVEGGLNFNKNNRIDKNCKVNQGLLYWTDNYNEPKKINIDSGIKLNYPAYQTTAPAYTTLTDSYEITLIRRPPAYSPIIEKVNDPVYLNNFIATSSWQFAWQYIYFDGETSVLSEYSRASMLNLVELDGSENYNFVNCKLSLLEKIPQTARIIRLVAKNQFTNNVNVIQTYDKLIDTTVFTNHNNGSVQLEFDYYGDVSGPLIDSVTAAKPFDSVPLLTKTLEIATNRLFLGNNLSGYNSPKVTSLSVSQTLSDSISNKRFFKNESSYQLGIAFYDKARRKSGVITQDNDLITTGLKTYAQPTFCKFFDITITAADLIDATGNTNGKDGIVYVDFIQCGGGSTQLQYTTDDTFYNQFCSDPANIALIEFSYWKNNVVQSGTGSSYATNTGNACNNDSLTQTATLDWQLSNTNAVNEIPDWAYYYSILRTDNLTTRYFIDSWSNTNKYAKKNLTTGNYDYTNTFGDGCIYFAIDTNALNQSGLGYNYTEGDVCILVSATDVRYKVPVIGQDGNYILTSLDSGLISIADLTNKAFVYEIYTPYIKSGNEPYYEVGNLYPITNPTASNRQYSTLTGNLLGDIFVLQRLYIGVYYWVEAMSPNDLFYKNWFTDDGFVNYVILLGQNRNQHEIRYSNVFAAGTQNNGFSTFEALNYKGIPLGTGILQKLQLAAKTTEQGVIMLSIGSFQTASCYLGEVQLVGSSANSSLAADTSVIGTINVLKGMFGTTAPETVVEYLGVIFWYDLNNGTIVQYSSNGLFPISSYKQEKLFKNYAKGYLSASSSNLDNINGFHHIPSYVDPYHKEFGISLPGLIYENYAEILPSYSSVPSYATSIINRFDVSDGLAKTMTFNIQENKWISDYQFMGEQYDYFENRMFGFKNGALYEFNTNSSLWNTWFGQQYPVRICWVLNKPLSGLKDMSEIVLEGSQAPNFTVIYTNLPNTQITDLANTDFTNQEGIFYARILRDRLSPNTTGTPDQKLNTGDVVLSQIPQIMAEFQSYNSIIYVNFVDVGFNLSRGQNFILGNQ
jgi:hypothetical protein